MKNNFILQVKMSKLNMVYSLTINIISDFKIQLPVNIIPGAGTKNGSHFNGKINYWYFNLDLERLKYTLNRILDEGVYVHSIERLVNKEKDEDYIQIYPKKENKYWDKTDTMILKMVEKVHAMMF